MQKQITAQAITEQMRLEFVDTEGLSTPLDANRCLTFIRNWQPSLVAAIPAPY